MITCTCPRGHTWQVATKRRGWNKCGKCRHYYRADELTDFLSPAAESGGKPDTNWDRQQQHASNSTPNF